jgi:hypothetical protein
MAKISIKEIANKLKQIQAIQAVIARFQPQQAQQSQRYMGPADNINILRQNTIDQTAYTPRAVQQIRNLPMNFFGNNIASNRYDEAGGGAVGSSIGLNVKYASPGVLRHEILHTLDDNTFLNSDRGGSLANSLGFSRLLQQQDPRANQKINQQMIQSGLYNMQNPDSQNTEKFAYYGQNPNVMLASQALAQRYNQIYQPMSKNINYSPLYPDPAKMSAYQLPFIPQQNGFTGTARQAY